MRVFAPDWILLVACRRFFDFRRPQNPPESPYSKRRRQDTLPIRSDTALELKNLLAGKLPDTPAFNMPPKYDVVKMLRADLADANIDYVDTAGRLLPHVAGGLL